MKRIYTMHKALALLLAVFVAALLWLGPAHAYTVKQTYSRISVTAGETLTTGQLVAIKDSDGYAYKADANVATLRPAVGIVNKGAASGSSVEIVTRGIVSGWTSLSEGAAAYLSETAGAVTQTAPFWAQDVGVAISSTEYLIDCTRAPADIVRIVAQSSTQTSVNGTTADVTGSSITIPAGVLASGETYEFEVFGTKAGANAAQKVHLYLDDGNVVSLTAGDGAAVDWSARFILAGTGAATQDLYGELKANGKSVVCDRATDTTNGTSAVTAKLVIESQNASDTVTADQMIVRRYKR